MYLSKFKTWLVSMHSTHSQAELTVNQSWKMYVSIWSTVYYAWLQRILLQKMPFFICQKVQSSSKILPQSWASFLKSQNKAFQQCVAVTVVNLFYKTLPKQFRGFWLLLIFSFVKKFCYKSRILLVFRHPKLSVCYNN